MEQHKSMKIYDKEDNWFARIISCGNPGYWYADRVGMEFPLSRECAEWDHVKVLLMCQEAELFHGDYELFQRSSAAVAAPADSDAKATVLLFPEGATSVTDGEQQQDEKQLPWIIPVLQYLEDIGINLDTAEIQLPVPIDFREVWKCSPKELLDRHRHRLEELTGCGRQ